jgi:hypothetical protein
MHKVARAAIVQQRRPPGGQALELTSEVTQDPQPGSPMSADAMSQPQADGEVDEALRVYEMGPSEREQWLRTSWDRLQSQADALYAGITFKREPGRQFRTIEEKNRSDESLEIEIEDPPS